MLLLQLKTMGQDLPPGSNRVKIHILTNSKNMQEILLIYKHLIVNKLNTSVHVICEASLIYRI